MAVSASARCLHLSGLCHVLDASHVSHSVSVQALSQDASQVQATDSVLGDGPASGGNCTHANDAGDADLCDSGALG